MGLICKLLSKFLSFFIWLKFLCIAILFTLEILSIRKPNRENYKIIIYTDVAYHIILWRYYSKGWLSNLDPDFLVVSWHWTIDLLIPLCRNSIPNKPLEVLGCKYSILRYAVLCHKISFLKEFSLLITFYPLSNTRTINMTKEFRTT